MASSEHGQLPQADSGSCQTGLMRLPPEIRTQIYEYVFTTNHEKHYLAVIANSRSKGASRNCPKKLSCVVWRPKRGKVNEWPLCVTSLDDLEYKAPSRQDGSGVLVLRTLVNAKTPPKLYLLCREIHSMALSHFYHNVTFGFKSPYVLARFLNSIPALACSKIQNIIIDMEIDFEEFFVDSGDDNGTDGGPLKVWDDTWKRFSPLLNLKNLVVRVVIWCGHYNDNFDYENFADMSEDASTDTEPVFERIISALGELKTTKCAIRPRVELPALDDDEEEERERREMHEIAHELGLSAMKNYRVDPRIICPDEALNLASQMVKQITDTKDDLEEETDNYDEDF